MEPELKTEEKQEEKKEPSLADKLRSLLSEFDNAPGAAEIEGLKAKHGDVFLSALNDDEVFLFRALTRKEHRTVNAAAAEGKIQGEAFEEEIVKTCLLWKSSPESLENKAGTIPSLFEQIMQNSNFLAPQLLSNLVTKL
jgi:hypothetical protein